MSSSVLAEVGLAAGTCRCSSGWNGLLQHGLSTAVCDGSTWLFALTPKQDLGLSLVFPHFRQQVGRASYHYRKLDSLLSER